MENYSIQNSTLGQAALELAGYGFRVFPLAPLSKRPFFKNFPWQELASNEPRFIKKWWSLEPNANIGVVADDLTIIDVDRKPCKPDGWAAIGSLIDQDTPWVATPNNGFHFYYLNPDGVKLRQIPGVDIQQGHKYVVAPPSKLSEGPYVCGRALGPPWDPGILELPQGLRERLQDFSPVAPDTDMPPLLENPPQMPLENLSEPCRKFLTTGDALDRSGVIQAVRTALGRLGHDYREILSMLWANDYVRDVAMDPRHNSSGTEARALQWLWKDTAKVAVSKKTGEWAQQVEGANVITPPPDMATRTAEDLLEHFVFVAAEEVVSDLRLPGPMSTIKHRTFEKKFANLAPVQVPNNNGPTPKSVSAVKWWLTNFDRKTVAGEGYKPGAPKIYREYHQGWLNMFYLPEHRETLQEDHLGVFFDHMAFLFPQEDRRELMLDWFAFNVQHPGDRLQFTPLLVARQHGMGRSWLARVLHELLGKWSCSAPKIYEVAENKWHDYLYRKLVVVIHETKERGKEAYKIDDRIRDLLTENRIEMNLKYGRNGTQDVYAKFLMMSNHVDALKLPLGDRRIWVHETPGEPQGRAYYDRLYQWLEGPGPRQLFWWLRRREIRTGLAGMIAPMTPEKRNMTHYAMSVTERAFWDIVDEGALKVATYPQIQQAVVSRCSGQIPDQGHLQKLVHDHCEVYTGGTPDARKVWAGGNMQRVWILDKVNQHQFQCLSLEQIRPYLS